MSSATVKISLKNGETAFSELNSVDFMGQYLDFYVQSPVEAVPQECFPDALQLLEANGYQPLGEVSDEAPRHVQYAKGGIEYELHHHFSTDGFACDNILERAMPKRIWCEMNQYEFPVLPDMENGLVLLLRDFCLSRLLPYKLFSVRFLREDAP